MDFMDKQVSLMKQGYFTKALKNINIKYPTLSTRITKISLIKKKYLEEFDYTKEYNEIIEKIDNIIPVLYPDKIDEWNDYKKLPAKEKLTYKGLELFERIPIVSSEFWKFKPDLKDLLDLHSTRSNILEDKHKKVVEVKYEKLYNFCKNNDYLFVLLSTGRRREEIMNGSFEKIDNNTALFYGQSKKTHSEAYIIPLLCCFDELQKRIERIEYGSTRKYYNLLKKFGLNLHKLRSVYALKTHTDKNISFNVHCKNVLGHYDLDTSLSYSFVRLV